MSTSERVKESPLLTLSGESVSIPTFTIPCGSVAPGNTCPLPVVPMKTFTRSVKSPNTAGFRVDATYGKRNPL